MRLRRLDLARYGHLADVVLEFPDEAALHVVHGPNEAGKSTALAAIGDALFGFPHRTAHDFQHGTAQLAIGFTIADAHGRTATLVRRKGRGDTLRDAAGRAMPDECLRPFLGGAGRDLFRRSFGLDGAGLREGGRELAASGGDAGESLLAGTGLPRLRAVLAQLDEQAKALAGDGRGQRRLSVAAKAWQDAQRGIDERAVAPAAWQEADAKRQAAEAALRRVQEETRALTAERNRLERRRRVAPLLRDLDEARRILEAEAAAPVLPADTAVRRREALDTLREAARDAERETADRDRLRAEREALSCDPAMLDAQDAIDALIELRTIAVQAEADLPAVRSQAATLRAAIAAARQEVGGVAGAVPTLAARQAVQRLIEQLAALKAAGEAARASLETAGRREAEAVAALAAIATPPDPRRWRRTIESVRGEGQLDRDVQRTGRASEAAAAKVDGLLAALPLWTGDAAALAAAPLPLPAAEAAAAAALATAGAALKATTDALAALVPEIADTASRILLLEQGAAVPTPAAVAMARAERDAAWRALRAAILAGDAAPLATLPDRFEVLRDAADRLADQRADDAQRVADYLAATAAHAALRQREADATRLAAQQMAALRDAQATWEALWRPSGVCASTPDAMREWRRARAEVLQAAEQASTAREQHRDTLARHEAARALLVPLLPADAAAGAPTLTALLLEADTRCTAAEAAVAEHARLREAVKAAAPPLADAQRDVANAVAALRQWQAGWATAVAALGLPPDIKPASGAAALAAWGRIAEAQPSLETAEGRIAAMTEGVERFAMAVAAIRARLGEAADDEPAGQAALRLTRRLKHAREAAQQAAALAQRIAAHDAAGTNAAQRAHDAAACLDVMRAAAGVGDDAALEAAIASAARRDAAAVEAARLEAALRAESDGLDEATLRAEVAATEADQAAARREEIGHELETLGQQRESLSAARTEANAALTAMQAGQDAAAKAQDAADALAEAAATAEEYARLHVARVMLRAGIERFRQEQQGPLLRAAGNHFARLTGGRYVRLDVEQDADDRLTLRAVSHDRTECPMEALSEGTRDQLYLALRVAAIEAQAGTLPFIADDLLVHFDDMRAAAALATLAELGKRTQVILFTHHDHIAELAARQPGAAIQRLPDPRRSAPPVAA